MNRLSGCWAGAKLCAMSVGLWWLVAGKYALAIAFGVVAVICVLSQIACAIEEKSS